MAAHDILSSFLVFRETANIPLIALGLKETKEIDFSTPFKVQKKNHGSASLFPPHNSNMCKSICMRRFFHMMPCGHYDLNIYPKGNVT